MNLERWKWRSSLGLTTGQASGRQDDTERRQWLEPAEGKAPRVLTRALRSLSSSSMDSSASSSIRSSHSTRRLQKSSSNTESIIGRLHRRVSRDFSGSIISAASGPIIDALPPYSAMAVLDYGPLKADVSLLKARSEYLVLSDQCLIKFSSGEAARSAFPQLIRASIQPSHISPHRHNSTKSASGDARLEIPLQAIVAAFDEDGPNQRAGIEVWWLSQWPRLAYFKTHLHFTLVKERDYWLTSIHRACRARLRKSSGVSLIPENLKARIHHIVQATEGVIDEAPQNLIFPVARCVFGPAPKSSSADEAHDNTETSSYYFVIGQCMCHLIEVCKADYSTAPGDLRAKATSCGTVTLIRLKASIASNEQRFIMCFRSPFGSELRLDLASVQYRRIIEALTKADRILKPMWPQHFQQAIFDVRGLAPPLQLTSGNDLGGLRKSLQAYSAAYHVRVPRWNIEWNTHPQPTFWLLPLQEGSYSPLQLIAVFRALRYNSFFKAISFRDVDLSPLMGKNDHPRYGDNVAYRSLNGLSISEDHHEILVQASILEQEMHALTFASESIRNIDMANVLGLRSTDRNLSRLKCDLGSLRAMSSELLRPMLMLWRKQLCACHSITLSGNPLALSDIDEFSNLLLSDFVHFKKLHLARCALGDAGLTKLWKGLAGQIHSLEFLDTSDNQGTVRFEIIQNTLKQLARITRLRITGNTRIPHGQSLFDAETMSLWALQELDLSEIVLNDNTVDILTDYLASDQSCKIEAIRLNNCGLTGAQVSRLFRGMGQARRVAVHLNANRLDQGIDDLCSAIACGYGPWCLFLQMTEFALEVNYIKLMRALTVNKTIQCLNLAGTAIPDAASTTTCQTIADFFSKNSTVRFLDISGFDSKLDEGRLGKEFSRALGGIRSNTGIEHFRVRSQMLNVNIGDLAEAVSANKTIHTLDCQGNDFNLSNFRHIVKNLAGNTTIRYFSAFSAQELSRAIGKSTHNASPGLPARRHSMISLFRHDKVQSTWGNAEIQNEWDDALAELQQILKRNQDLFDKHECSHSGFVSRTRRDCNTNHGFSSVFGGLARRDFESRRAKGLQDSAVSRTIFESTVQPGSNGLGEEGPRPRSSISSDLVLSPSITDGASAVDAPSPLEPESPNKNQEDSPIEEGRKVTVLDEVQDSNYTFCKDFDADVGAQMKKYQRFLSGGTSRIEEEEDGIELERTQTQSDRC